MLILALLPAVLATASARDNTNTTVQTGQVNINRTVQCGDSNDNTTHQDGRININQTVQGGCGGKGHAYGRSGDTQRGQAARRTGHPAAVSRAHR
ncbi:curlin [Thioalkalivibrio paradoxus ARh 1]|uniref:Curlin n=1 Tax=Thioalkalivibrio paradoxus ARh 1 TaxID=713585 RepID=W0DH78_9GAMM|nr:curlin [Thioalkalivibrio paradoxus ARh 1]